MQKLTVLQSLLIVAIKNTANCTRALDTTSVPSLPGSCNCASICARRT